MARMSSDGRQSQSRGSVDFVETSILDTIIPFSTTIDIKEALHKSVNEGAASPLASIKQRQTLFFGGCPFTGYGSVSYLFIDPR